MPRTTRKRIAPPVLAIAPARRSPPILVGVALLLLGVLLGILAASAPRPSTPSPSGTAEVSLSALSTDGYVEVEPSVDVENVYFTAGCTQIGMETTDFQTYSIQNGIDKIIEVRPTVHDVMKDWVDAFGMEVLMIKLDSKDGTELGYHADIFLKEGGKVVSLESRPSDGTALAVRTGAKLWFKQDTFEQLGTNIC